jgi:hypothetical protein
MGVPLREHCSVRYFGGFYGQDRDGTSLPDAVAPEALVRLVREVPEGDNELACHPAAAAESFTSYAAERPLELRALCDPGVRRAVQECEIRLCSFRELTASG